MPTNGQMVKAMLMRRLTSAVCKWGTDTLFVYHHYDGNVRGKETVNSTVSGVEQARLQRALNLELETVYDDSHNRYGIKVLWSRNGRQFPQVPILWDDTGTWEGMPEEIEKAVYDNVKRVSALMFKSAQDAITWAVDEGYYHGKSESSAAYESVKSEAAPKSARAMWDAWIAHCNGLGEGNDDSTD